MTPPKLEELRKIPFQDRYDAFNAPSVDDVDDIVSYLVEAVKERWRTLGWKHPDLYYRIGYYSPFPSGMDPDLTFDIHCKVQKALEGA